MDLPVCVCVCGYLSGPDYFTVPPDIFLIFVHPIQYIDISTFNKKQHIEAAQMKFLRHLFGISKLDKEKNQEY